MHLALWMHGGLSARWFSRKGALDEKTKQLIAVAVAHVTQCRYCIRSHTSQAMKKGASKEQIMECIWVASEMRAGAAYAHASLPWMKWMLLTNRKFKKRLAKNQWFG